jgi:hypothetical protein
MTDGQIQTKAIIAAALIQSRAVDPEGLGSGLKDVAEHKLRRLRELTNRIYDAIASESDAER